MKVLSEEKRFGVFNTLKSKEGKRDRLTSLMNVLQFVSFEFSFCIDRFYSGHPHFYNEHVILKMEVTLSPRWNIWHLVQTLTGNLINTDATMWHVYRRVTWMKTVLREAWIETLSAEIRFQNRRHTSAYLFFSLEEYTRDSLFFLATEWASPRHRWQCSMWLIWLCRLWIQCLSERPSASSVWLPGNQVQIRTFPQFQWLPNHVKTCRPIFALNVQPWDKPDDR